jgi:outer membrane protein OmpA-like peptidoglycan-associated protein
MTSLSLSDDTAVRTGGRGRGLAAIAALLLLVLCGISAYVGYRVLQHLEQEQARASALDARVEEAQALAREARQRAEGAEAAARTASEGRQAAEAGAFDLQQQRETAVRDAESARQEADAARATAVQAQAEAERIRKKAEAEVSRLEAALGQIGETRRTALGLVMNLGSNYLKFEFDKAELRPEDKELLSRIAGILMTSQDYTLSVNGHTDDVGSDEYNKKLSERRAQAVRDYLVKAGLSPDILSVEGHGKSLPLVRGGSETARAKNRRVELGIVNTQIRYAR